MAKEYLGRGWKFPFSLDNRHHVAMSEYEQDIREAIHIILGTARGERVMRPEFGCGIHDYVFAVLSTSNLQLIEKSVREAILIWEPRVDLIAVELNREKANDGILLISIEYLIPATNNRFNLVYPFYLKEG